MQQRKRPLCPRSVHPALCQQGSAKERTEATREFISRCCCREVNPSERVRAQDVDVVLERTDTIPEDKRAELKGKCHVRGCGKSVMDLRDFNQRYHICGDHIKVR